MIVSGCFNKSYLLDVQEVEGIVTLDDAPFDNVTVTFMPLASGEMGFALTDPSGKYHLSALGGKPQGGTTVGEYGVSFNKAVPAAETGDKITQYVPKKYLDTGTSGFAVKVEKGKNVFNFDLKSK